MRMRRSQLTDVVTIHAGSDHLTITPGQVVDLDARIGAGTVAEALGSLADAFVADAPEEAPGPEPGAPIDEMPGKKPGEPKRRPAASGGA